MRQISPPLLRPPTSRGARLLLQILFGNLEPGTYQRVRVLGLDLSLRSTGYVLLDDHYAGGSPRPDAEVVWHGCVGGANLRDVARLEMFDAWICRVLTVGIDAFGYRKLRLDHVAVEGYSFASTVGLAQQGELGGVIKLALHKAGIPIHVIPPATWKKLLLGKGNLAKDQVRLESWKRYGVEFASQDTLDAWAVAMCLRRQLLGLDKPEAKSRKKKNPGSAGEPTPNPLMGQFLRGFTPARTPGSSDASVPTLESKQREIIALGIALDRALSDEKQLEVGQ